MPAEHVYLMDPESDGLEVLEIAQELQRRGYSPTTAPKDAFVALEAKKLLIEKGATKILSTQMLVEEVLPDETSMGVLLDTLRYKLS